jgi:5'-nucleotidase
LRLALVAVLVVAALVPAAGARPAAPVAVQLLAINDFHGNLEPPAGSGGLINGRPAGGAQFLASYLKQDVRENPRSLIVAAGDLIGASPLLSALFHDEPTIESMNLMNLTVSSVGNHEFDEGWHELVRMQHGGCHPVDGCQDGDGFAGAKFTYLSANVLRDPTDAEKAAVTAYNARQKARVAAHKAYCKRHRRAPSCLRPFRVTLKPAPKPAPLLPPTAVRTVGGVKIGFIGETLKETPTIVTPTGVAGLTFLDEAAVANRYAAQLRRQGVNTIVLLIHQGGQQSPASDPNGCAGFSGDIVPIVQRLSKDIDVVVSGHTHQFYNCTIAGKLVTSASSFGRMVTRISLRIDPATGKVVSKSAFNQVVLRDGLADVDQLALIAKYGKLSAPLANKVVGSISSSITRAQTSAGESALGDVIADSQLASTSPANKGSAVVAFMNPGGIRADLIYAGSGQVTYSDLFTVQPFSNVMAVETLTGDQIRRVLEQQFDNPTPGSDRVLQVSRGFTYSYDRSRPAGQRVDPSSIRIGGVPVAPTGRYRVAMNGFLQAGGDNFTVFTEGTSLLGGDIDIDAFVAWFEAHSPVAPGPRDRITRTG